MSLGEALTQAREASRLSQDDVGLAMGVSRAMISYWEGGQRSPNDRQLLSLAKVFGLTVGELLRGQTPEEPDLTRMLLRSKVTGVEVKPGVRNFISFLETYSDLAEDMGHSIRGMKQSPWVYSPDFGDARRKAEEVRKFLGLGVGPIPDLDSVCEQLGITLYRVPLGSDLELSPSGVFYAHQKVGFSVLVNLDMTRGRRRFTVAHEIAHALFHSETESFVVSSGQGKMEAFADRFAGEFLMPQEGVTRFLEETGARKPIRDEIDVVRLQRYFSVSFPMALVRLRQMKLLKDDVYEHMKTNVRPLAVARALGYRLGPDEYGKDGGDWGLRKYPRAFLALLRRAIIQENLTHSSAASLAGVSLPEITGLVGPSQGSGSENETERMNTEFVEFESSVSR